MRTIFLLRHAKSDWAHVDLQDHDRPLNARGRDAAPKMAAYIEAKRYRPDLVLCSTALRTVETFDLVKKALGHDVEVKFEEGLYLAEQRQLLERLQWIDDKVKAVMLIGHNPGMAELAHALSGAADDADEEKLRRRMSEKFSTCALAAIEAPAKSWRALKPGSGKLKDFMRPKDL